ncbi:Capsule polysaccharide export inner-membrane protein BexC [Gammaproteobacteria bacterium]
MTENNTHSNQGLIARVKNLNLLFILTVFLPTLLSVIYFSLIASDVYISESSFVIRTPEQKSTSSFGLLLKGVGFSRSLDDAYTVQTFILSRDALRTLDERMRLGNIFSSNDVDIFSRFGGFRSKNSFEDLYIYYQKHVDVQLDSVSSSVKLTIRAFTAEDSFRINQSLLEMSETLVNHLNERGRQDMIHFAAQEVADAEKSAKVAALAVARYRNEKNVIDPEKQSSIPLQHIAKLQDELITTKTQIVQLEKIVKDNPQIPILRQRVQLLEKEIKQEESGVAGSNDRSLAGKAVEYQRLAFEKEFADKMLASAMSTLEQARNEARRKQFYLERIVQPGKPDMAVEPRRLRAMITTFIMGMISWGILSILIAGVREHND